MTVIDTANVAKVDVVISVGGTDIAEGTTWLTYKSVAGTYGALQMKSYLKL